MKMMNNGRVLMSITTPYATLNGYGVVSDTGSSGINQPNLKTKLEALIRKEVLS